MIKYILLIFSVCSKNDGPVLPKKFSMTFNEENSFWYIFKGKTKGKFYYHQNIDMMSVERESGWADPYCSTTSFFFSFMKSTPCTHLVRDGKRYLHFPEKNYCCLCCTG